MTYCGDLKYGTAQNQNTDSVLHSIVASPLIACLGGKILEVLYVVKLSRAKRTRAAPA
jgi:hypothetical protein